MKSIGTDSHIALVELITEERIKAGLTQRNVADALGEFQSWVQRLESGQKRINIIEFFEIARVIGFNPYTALRRIFR